MCVFPKLCQLLLNSATLLIVFISCSRMKTFSCNTDCSYMAKASLLLWCHSVYSLNWCWIHKYSSSCSRNSLQFQGFQGFKIFHVKSLFSPLAPCLWLTLFHTTASDDSPWIARWGWTELTTMFPDECQMRLLFNRNVLDRCLWLERSQRWYSEGLLSWPRSLHPTLMMTQSVPKLTDCWV